MSESMDLLKEEQSRWHSRLGGRKFLIIILGMVMGFTLAMLQRLTGEFTTVLVTLTGFFTAGNTAATISALRAGKQEE